MNEPLTEQERLVLRKALDSYAEQEMRPTMKTDQRIILCNEKAVARNLSYRLT